MGFKPKTNKPFPPRGEMKLKEWAGKYFDWEQTEGEHYSTELSKLGTTHGEGHPDYVSKETDTVTLSKADLQKMLDGIEKKLEAKFTNTSVMGQKDDMRDLVTELVEQLNPVQGQRHRAKYEVQVDKSDYLPEPVMFFTYKNYYAIHSETRYSHEVKTPYGRPIVFQNISGHITGNSRGGKQTVQIAAAQIQTQKELDWMRSSPKFNVMFFEKMRDVTDIDPIKASHLAQAMSEISGFTEYQVMQRALSAGIPADTDVEQMRRKLIQLIANQNIEMERAVSRNAASTADSSLETVIKRGVNANQIAGNSVMSY